MRNDRLDAFRCLAMLLREHADEPTRLIKTREQSRRTHS